MDAPGVVRIPRIERLRTLTGTAHDAAGNRTASGAPTATGEGPSTLDW